MAYPFRMLQYHEIVNGRVGGRPVLVTYTPLCRTARVYERTIGGEPAGFDVSGELMQGSIVMVDNATGRRWDQFTGHRIGGGPGRQSLDRIEAKVMPFRRWRQEHPGTGVLDREEGGWAPGRYTQPVTARQPGSVNVTPGGIEGVPAVLLGLWCSGQ